MHMKYLMRGLKSLLRRTGLLGRFYHVLNRLHPTFGSLHPANLIAITRAMNACPDGDYYEFGVYKGFSLWFATQIAQEYGHADMRFFGFDSFEGLPEPVGVDRKPDAHGSTFAKGCFCAGLSYVESALKKNGADMTKVTLVKGYYEDVLVDGLVAERDMKPAAVILVDCDMYNSTMVVLRFIKDLLVPGTVLLFDDWLLTDEKKGQQLACREWLEENPAIRLDEFCKFDGGKGFVVSVC